MIPGNANPLLLASAAAADTAADITKSLRFNSGDSAYLNRTPSSAGNRKTWTWSAWVKRSTLGTNQKLFSAGTSSNYFALAFNTSDQIQVDSYGGGANAFYMHTGDMVFRDASAWYSVVAVLDTTESTGSDRFKLYINGSQVTLTVGTNVPPSNADQLVNSTIEHKIGNISFGGTTQPFDGFMAGIYFIDGSALDPTSFGAYDDNGVWQSAAYSGTFGTNGFHLLDFENESTVGHDSSGNENDYTANNISTAAGAGNDVLFDVPTNGTQSDTGAGGEVSGNYCTMNPLRAGVNSNPHILSNGNLDIDHPSSDAWSSAYGTLAASSGKWYWEQTWSEGLVSIICGIGNEFAQVNNYPADTHSLGYYFGDGSIYTGISGLAGSHGAAIAIGDVLGVALDVTAGTVDFYKNGSKQGSTITHNITGHVGPLVSSYSGKLTMNFGQRPFAYSAPSGYKALCTTNLPTPTIADGSAHFDIKLWTGNASTDRDITGLSYSPDLTWIKIRNGVYGHFWFDTIRGATKDLNSEENYIESTVATSLQSFESDGFNIGNSVYVNQNGETYVAWNWNAGANSNKTYTVKVVSDSGNKYRFDDFGTSAVTLDLAEGSTYVFDQSDSSNSGHPLRFSTTSDGTHNSGSEYTTGVTTTGTPGSAGAKTTIVVAASAPTLYYYCSAHSGMGGQANTNSTAGASNFDGSIQATVKANQTAGFSIVSYTGNATAGATVGHGLNAEPSLVIAKCRESAAATNWATYHRSIGGTHGAYLDTANGFDDSAGYWNDTNPTNSVVTLGNFDVTNANNVDLIMYAFAPVAGYSAFGKFTSQNSNDNAFVYLGFRPKFLIIKGNYAGTASWYLMDTSRDPDNIAEKILKAQVGNAEATSGLLDILSNGFKFRFSLGTYDVVYMAWAENPFQANGGLAR